ncbi:MAG: flagellar basal body-associated FliL family protein [Deltaproteobacteria bacterium]|nr:flagellar basal body-associated FliL family protein [Deltaproteobacteria bacterium]
MAEAAKEKVVLEEGAAAAEGKSAKSSKTKLIAIVAAVVLLLGGGGAAAYFLVLKPKHDAKVAEGGGEEEGGGESEGHGKATKEEHGGEKKAEHGEKSAKSEKGGHGAKGEKNGSDSNNVPLEPFIVNLNDPTGNRYLKVDMVLEMRGDGCAEAIAAKRERLRDSIILLLRSKTMADLQDVDGVLNLKKEVITRANYEQDTCKALDLLFTDLVIQ